MYNLQPIILSAGFNQHLSTGCESSAGDNGHAIMMTIPLTFLAHQPPTFTPTLLAHQHAVVQQSPRTPLLTPHLTPAPLRPPSGCWSTVAMNTSTTWRRSTYCYARSSSACRSTPPPTRPLLTPPISPPPLCAPQGAGRLSR